MKAIEILKRISETPQDLFRYSDKEIKIAITELEALENRSCNNCKNASFEVKFGELEFNACFLVSNGYVCKWEPK